MHPTPGDAEFLPGLWIVNRRNAPPVEEQPHMELIQWRVLISAGGHIHLIGFLLERPTIRLTTAVLSLWEREALTSSGRHYTLVGEPGEDEEARALIELRAIELGPGWRDVTDFYWPLRKDSGACCNSPDSDPGPSGSSNE
jgi:hypothetical protein